MKSHIAIRTATILLGLLLFAGNAHGQQTTNTDCTLSGNTANCTSNTTDYGAQQQQAYETGQQVGNAIGQGLASAMQHHAFSKGVKKYCAAHPGQDWHYYSGRDGHVLSSGHCPSDEDKDVAAANEFMAHHKDFIPCAANSKVMVAYIEVHKFDPREQKSYERAYKALKKSGKLDLYTK
ncbi:MAG: hypothetical protein ACYCOR_14405 [Acidobacteriaceae bacterium]